jgi:hypothetical protein
MLCANAVLAEPPAPLADEDKKAAAALVEKELVRPLTKAESKRKRFSRAAPAAAERRVRIEESVAEVDAHGKTFVRFAVDERMPWDEPGEWTKDALLGCAYLTEAKVYVRRGDAYLPARSAVGAQEKPLPDVCRPAAQLAAVTGPVQR